MANYKVTAKELSNLMRLTFDNTTGEDVVAEVLPVYAKKLGGVEGILKALAVDKHKGINQNDFVDRKNLFGENKVEQDPQVRHPFLIRSRPCFSVCLEQRTPSLLVRIFRGSEPIPKASGQLRGGGDGAHDATSASMVSCVTHARGGGVMERRRCMQHPLQRTACGE